MFTYLPVYLFTRFSYQFAVNMDEDGRREISVVTTSNMKRKLYFFFVICSLFLIANKGEGGDWDFE